MERVKQLAQLPWHLASHKRISAAINPGQGSAASPKLETSSGHPAGLFPNPLRRAHGHQLTGLLQAL